MCSYINNRNLPKPVVRTATISLSFSKYSKHFSWGGFKQNDRKLQRLKAYPSVSQEDFYKRQQKTKDCKITLYLEDFCDKAKSFFKEKMVNQLELSPNDREEPSEVSLLTKWEDTTITRKQWIYKNNEVFTQDNKEVIPKRELFQVLSHVRTQTNCTQGKANYSKKSTKK